MKNKSRLVSVLLVLIFLSGLIYFISYAYWISKAVRYPFGLGSYSETGTHKINPETILTALSQGKTDVFALHKPHSDEDIRLFSPGSFSRHQTDYLEIGNAFHKIVFREKLNNWNLYDMHFVRDCKDNPSGFDLGILTYFKSKPDRLSGYETHHIIISPLWGEVEWGQGASYPHPPLFGWKSIDLDRHAVTADDVLQIAEKSGGREARSKIKNACKISIILSPNTDSGYVWRVYYSPSFPFYDTETFEIHINPNKFR